MIELTVAAGSGTQTFSLGYIGRIKKIVVACGAATGDVVRIYSGSSYSAANEVFYTDDLVASSSAPEYSAEDVCYVDDDVHLDFVGTATGGTIKVWA